MITAGTGAPDLISVKQAAKLANVAPVTVYRCIARGEIPAVRVGEAMGPLEARLALARSRPADERTRIGFEPEDAEPPTWGERALAAERRLAGIDAEINRVSER